MVFLVPLQTKKKQQRRRRSRSTIPIYVYTHVHIQLEYRRCCHACFGVGKLLDLQGPALAGEPCPLSSEAWIYLGRKTTCRQRFASCWLGLVWCRFVLVWFQVVVLILVRFCVLVVVLVLVSFNYLVRDME